MKIDKNVELIRELTLDLIENNSYRERKEFLSAYFNGLEWFANNRGGELLNANINTLVDKAKDQNNIYCFDTQLKELINDKNITLEYDKSDIKHRIKNCTFIHELKSLSYTVDKVYCLLYE